MNSMELKGLRCLRPFFPFRVSNIYWTLTCAKHYPQIDPWGMDHRAPFYRWENLLARWKKMISWKNDLRQTGAQVNLWPQGRRKSKDRANLKHTCFGLLLASLSYLPTLLQSGLETAEHWRRLFVRLLLILPARLIILEPPQEGTHCSPIFPDGETEMAGWAWDHTGSKAHSFQDGAWNSVWGALQVHLSPHIQLSLFLQQIPLPERQ